MKTVWQYSSQTEALRLLHIAHNIITGFFRVNGFIPLPYGNKHHSENIVTVPDLPYLSIPRFWQKASQIDIAATPSIKITAPQSLIQASQNLLTTIKLPVPDTTATQKAWGACQNRVVSQIYQLIPHLAGTIRKITIWPTAFGTGASFNLVRRPPYDIHIWLRADRGIAAIVEAMLTSLTRLDVYSQLGGMWSESEIIVDWLLKYSPLYSLLRQSDPNVDRTYTIKATRAIQTGKLLQESAAFLAHLGAPTTDTSTLKNLVTNGVLSLREKEILQLLLSHSPQVVTFDEIGNILFSKNPDNFSLYAITKQVQRLRDKLEKNGISGSFIQTKRGKGYLLVN